MDVLIIMQSFTTELQLKNAEFVIKNKKLLSELRGFKFVITLVLNLKNKK